MKRIVTTLLIVLLLPSCVLRRPDTGQIQGQTRQGTGLSVYLFNNCPNNTTWHVQIQGPNTDVTYDFPQGVSRGLTYIDPGTYQITEWTDEDPNQDISTVEVPDDGVLRFFSRALCGGTEATARYYLANNCVGTDPTDGHSNTVWHWTFQMVSPAESDGQLIDPMELIIPLGQSVGGELPGGMYVVRDWTENGAVDNEAYVATSEEIGFVYVNLCPGNDPLPDAPPQP
jgi:hypothetical protein